jgi:5'-nucleotidase
MRILCTNDDGIHAPGLVALERIAHALTDDVWVVAPELDQSGLSHSLSLNDPLRLREVGDKKFAVRGTPSFMTLRMTSGPNFSAVSHSGLLRVSMENSCDSANDGRPRMVPSRAPAMVPE